MPSCAPPAAADCRCTCGSLLARVVEGRVELKCRRCKRTQLVPLAPEAWEAARGPSSARRAGAAAPGGAAAAAPSEVRR